MRVKVCGITSPADALDAAELGASAVGIVFWPESPRHVDVETARRIVAALPPFVGAVGVFVNQVEEARRVIADVRLAAVQFHGDEDAESCLRFPIPVIKAVTIAGGGTHRDVGFATTTVLLDAHDPIKRGGTGRTIDWSIAASIARTRRVILSGGLNASNVGQAIRAVRPYAVDVSSGVESAPGRKDREKLRAFFAAVDAAGCAEYADKEES